MVLTNSSEKTVITTTTAPSLQQPLHSNMVQAINKEAVITNIMDKPILENVIEKKNVEVHHQNVVQEIHEQKIIEIERKPVLQNINQGTLVEQSKVATRYEEIGTGNLGEQERLRLERLRLSSAPKIVQQQGLMQEVRDGDVVSEVVRQEFIEHHVQPVITEIREQNVVQDVVHPIIRTVHEAPIVREVQYTQPTNFVQGSTLPMTSGLNQSSNYREFESTQQSGFVQGSSMPNTGLNQAPLFNNNLQRNTTSNLSQSSSINREYQQTGFGQGSTIPMNSGINQAPMTNNLQRTSGNHQVNIGNMDRVTTTTTAHGTSTTTSTSDAPVQAEIMNMNQHESKVLASEGGHLTNAEYRNLDQHERVVEKYAKGTLPQGNFDRIPNTNTMGTTQTTQPLTTSNTTRTTQPSTTTVNRPVDETAHKQGFMTKLKEKMHMGSHNK